MKALAIICLLARAAQAAPFDYPTAVMNAAYLEGINGAYGAKFVPGSLENCKTNSPSPGPGPSPSPGPVPGFTTHSCDIKGGQLEIDVAGTQKLVVLQNIMVMEYTGTSGVVSVSYNLQGIHGTSLPDGSPYESGASISLSRHPQHATKMQGSLNVYSMGINGSMLMDWPAPPPTP